MCSELSSVSHCKYLASRKIRSIRVDEEGISLAEKWIFLRKLETDFLQNFEYFLHDDVGKIEVASN